MTGNITRDGRGFTYAYDFDNQLTQANNASGDLVGRYEYDALGRRTQRTASDPAAGTSVTTTYVCLTDGSGMGQVVSEYDEGELVRQSTYGSYIDEPLTLHVKSGSGAFQTYWYHQDRQYNIVGLSDDSGDVVERYAYTPYGERRVLDPDGVTQRSASGFGSARGHQGLWHDDETGLIYNRARYRSTSLGRWMGRDPLGYVDGMSMYAYYAGMRGGLDSTGKSTTFPNPTPHDGGCPQYYKKKCNKLCGVEVRQQSGRICNGFLRAISYWDVFTRCIYEDNTLVFIGGDLTYVGVVDFRCGFNSQGRVLFQDSHKFATGCSPAAPNK